MGVRLNEMVSDDGAEVFAILEALLPGLAELAEGLKGRGIEMSAIQFMRAGMLLATEVGFRMGAASRDMEEAGCTHVDLKVTYHPDEVAIYVNGDYVVGLASYLMPEGLKH